MNEQPRQPGEIAGQLELAELGDGGGAADGGQAAFIVIVKIASRLVLEIARDRVRDPVPLLDRDWRDARQHLAILVSERGQVANHEYFRMSGDAEIGLHEHAPGAVDGHTQLSAQRRSGDAGGP